jgi:hypothetical protein
MVLRRAGQNRARLLVLKNRQRLKLKRRRPLKPGL